MSATTRSSDASGRSRVPGRFRFRLAAGRPRLYLLAGALVPLLLVGLALVYYYLSFSRMIDGRLQGEREATVPRVYARPFQATVGDAIPLRQMVDRLNDLGYANRPRVAAAGEFAIGREAIALIPRSGPHEGRTLRIVFSGTDAGGIREIVTVPPSERVQRLTLESPLITALGASREKRRHVPLSRIPTHMVQAVLAIEDHRFYDHPGVDLIGVAGAMFTNIFGDKPYLAGGSTITQQLVKNMFLTPEKSPIRKLKDQYMALIMETRLSKNQILEMYLNDVYLGQRGSFAIHGVGEAARLFYGKDVSNVTLTEAATIAGVIQTARHSPFKSMERARERRNVVLGAMAEANFITKEAAARAVREPVVIAPRALDTEAPYFIDFIGQELQERYADLTASAKRLDVYTTLDLSLQRIAQDAVRAGLAQVDQLLARRKRGPAQAALVAVDPRSGEILAMVGGRSYNQSQYNRAVSARRQPGSVFKPFVYLAAFERAAEEGRTDLTPASVVADEPTEFTHDEQVYQPRNYDGEYDGAITFRRALALSRNIAAVKVAEAAGFDRVAALWRRIGQGSPARPYPSIALGVFEASPVEIATAFTLFPNGGAVRPLHAIARLDQEGRSLAPPIPGMKRAAREDTTFLVLNMMRSVLNEGTGAGARAAGFAADAAGKSGTTNDLRDAWFVGFTPELLTVVWVGLDDNQPVGLSGTQAALPIWTAFMKRAVGGRRSGVFDAPDGIVYVDIDRDTGRLAAPGCPRIFREAFLAGEEPTETCVLHTFYN
ncbi:MAG: PBP1A family penicillin-binding protein [Acidobacteria bacterium]|nr:PBP1A family penicillin-binding protein [Acidobacteriota bacterium]